LENSNVNLTNPNFTNADAAREYLEKGDRRLLGATGNDGPD
jgi:hypothetical protein